MSTTSKSKCTEVSGAGLPVLRKRRAASLTAEALWNIQMEEDVGGKSALQKKRQQSSDPLLELVNPVVQTNAGGDWNVSSNGASKRPTVSLSQEVTPACVHLPNRSRKETHTNRSRGKPVASVVPLVKSETTRPIRFSEERQRIESSSGNSPVLLLPISLNTGLGPAVPVLTLHPSSLMSCLSASTLVNVGPILTGSTVSHTPWTGSGCQPCHLVRPTVSGEFCQSDITDQTEPLNLKLGESSIPSGGVYQKTTGKRNIMGIPAPSQREERRSFPIYLKNPFPVIKNEDSPIPENGAQWIQIKNEAGPYTAYSPSSESSGSADPDEGLVTLTKARGKRRMHINLRCKAATPPGQVVPRNKKSRKSMRRDSNDNNGWSWDGRAYNALVFSVEAGKPVIRRCFPSMRRKPEYQSKTVAVKEEDDDVVMVRDCVIMRADGDEQPYVAKVAALWEQPSSGKMMISLLWFYRPEHTEDVRVLTSYYNNNELFASRHLDEISVECVEDKCFVLTYNQYCRYIATSKRMEDHVGAINGRNLIPIMPHSRGKQKERLLANEDPSHVYFCRKLYDIKSHRLLKTFSPPATLFYANSQNNNSMMFE